jgi:hypothetical protein
MSVIRPRLMLPAYMVGRVSWHLLESRVRAGIVTDMLRDPAMCERDFNPHPTQKLPGFHAQPTAHVTQIIDHNAPTEKDEAIDLSRTITMPTVPLEEVSHAH